MTDAARSINGAGKWLELLFENLDEYAIVILDLDGRVLIWGAGAVRHLGYSESEIVGRPLDFVFTMEDRTNGLFDREIETATVEGSASDENWMVRKDGSRFWASGALTALRDQSKSLLGFGKIFRDLTATRQAEHDLRKSAAERLAAEEEIRQARDELEVRVNERTAKLNEVVLALKAEVAERRQVQQARQELLARLVNAQEAERERIARDLHDILGQFVAALNLKLKAMQDGSRNGQTPAAFDELFRLTKEIGLETHRLATELRPRALDEIGLRGAVQQLLESWGERTKIGVEFVSRGLDSVELPTEIATGVYRIVQEALTNVARHANASRVGVAIEKTDGVLVTVVDDDGDGFDSDEEGKRRRSIGGLGILGMKERAMLAGGRLQIESTPGNGTSIFARIPLTRQGGDDV